MPLSTRIERQIDQFIDRLESYNKKLLHPRAKENYRYIRTFFKQLVKDYNDRGEEVASKAYQKVRALANKQFPVRTLWIECIDGRVLTIHAHGATANVGSSIRVPGGNLREFIHSETGQLKLIDDSDFAVFLRRAFTDFGVDEVAEVFDSHVGCAARKGEEVSKGNNPQDSGLLADVIQKQQVADATREYVRNTFGPDKKIVTVQTSFDPHTGFLYMGLETDKALAYARKNGNFYTQEVLDALTKSGKIISTFQFTQEPQVMKILKDYTFTLDWQHKYIQTAGLFWKNIALLRPLLLPKLIEKLKLIYPRLTERNVLRQKELEERAVLLLTNIYIGYLNNLKSNPTHDNIVETSSHKNLYPYGVHREQGVRVSESAYSPYKTPMFAVFNGEERNLADDIELASSLIRSNRKEGRIKYSKKYFTDVDSFVKATVPIIVQEVVRDKMTKNELTFLEKLSWDDLPRQWNTMGSVEFLRYLKTKGLTQLTLGMSIDKLRRHMALLYNPYSSLSNRLIENYEVALPIIVGKYRESFFIVPFVKLGYE